MFFIWPTERDEPTYEPTYEPIWKVETRHEVIYPPKLFVDDIRDPVDDTWYTVRTFHKAIVLLEEVRFEEVSLDHDLACFYGNKEMTGNNILGWLIERKLAGKYVPKKVHVHSQNCVGVETMLQDIEKYWK